MDKVIVHAFSFGLYFSVGDKAKVNIKPMPKSFTSRQPPPKHTIMKKTFFLCSLLLASSILFKTNAQLNLAKGITPTIIAGGATTTNIQNLTDGDKGTSWNSGTTNSTSIQIFFGAGVSKTIKQINIFRGAGIQCQYTIRQLQPSGSATVFAPQATSYNNIPYAPNGTLEIPVNLTCYGIILDISGHIYEYPDVINEIELLDAAGSDLTSENVFINKNATIYGNTDIKGNLTVASLSTFNDLTINANLRTNLIIGNLTINGNPTISGILNTKTILNGWASTVQNQGCIVYSAYGNGTADGYGMHIKVNNTRGDRYALMCYDGTNTLFKVGNDGNSSFSGNVGIGVTDTKNYKLAVNGDIHARRIKIDLNGWADVVFSGNYKTKTLPEIENYIKTHGHLENVPNESDVKDNGIDVGEMNKILLQKVEEITLLLIEQNKKVSQMAIELDKLKSQK